MIKYRDEKFLLDEGKGGYPPSEIKIAEFFSRNVSN